jgi:hypothetical protein
MVIMVEGRRRVIVSAIRGAIVALAGSLTALRLEAPLASRLIPDPGGRSGCGG